MLKIEKNFNDKWEKFKTDFADERKKFEEKYTVKKGGRVKKGGAGITDDHKAILDMLWRRVDESMEEIKKHIRLGVKSIRTWAMTMNAFNSGTVGVMMNTIAQQLFTTINAIYSGTYVKMLKDIRLSPFSLNGRRNLLREYLNDKIMDLPELTNLSLKKYNKNLKEINIMLNNFIPRSKSSLVKYTLQQRAGEYEIIKLNLNKYKRKDLNKLAKKIGLANVEKIKNKNLLIQRINSLIFFKAGSFRKREDLSVIASFVNINPKSYKRKIDLMRKVNKTIF